MASKTTTVCTCDICGKRMDEPYTQLEIDRRFDGDKCDKLDLCNPCRWVFLKLFEGKLNGLILNLRELGVGENGE